MDTLDNASPLLDNATRVLMDQFELSAIRAVVTLVEVAIERCMKVEELVELVSAYDVHARAGEQARCTTTPPHLVASGERRPVPCDLTDRERQLMEMITNGRSNAQIAAELFLSVNSIKGNIRTCYRKLGLTNRVEAVLWGVDHGLRKNC